MKDSIHTHVSLLQEVIQRMASNSASCKTWCITVVAAILVLTSDSGNSEIAFVAIGPTFLFLMLDAYYLGLEKGFRYSYEDFILLVHSNSIKPEDLYVVKPKGEISGLVVEALRSPAVWPFYLFLLCMTLAARLFLLKDLPMPNS